MGYYTFDVLQSDKDTCKLLSLFCVPQDCFDSISIYHFLCHGTTTKKHESSLKKKFMGKDKKSSMLCQCSTCEKRSANDVVQKGLYAQSMSFSWHSVTSFSIFRVITHTVVGPYFRFIIQMKNCTVKLVLNQYVCIVAVITSSE